MIRTNVVTLSVIKAIAYRQKLPAGGSRIVIIRADSAQPGIASVSKTSGEPVFDKLAYRLFAYLVLFRERRYHGRPGARHACRLSAIFHAPNYSTTVR